MNKIIVILVSAFTLMVGGCIWPPTPPTPHHNFPKFTTNPKEMRGWGLDTSCLYCDTENTAEQLVINNCNVTHVEIFNCSPTKETSQSADPSPHGYWTFDKFDSQLKAPLDAFLTAMQSHKVTVVLVMFGGHDMSKVNDDIFFKILNFLKARSQGIECIIINLAAEPGPWTKEPYPGYFTHLTQMLDQNWSGMKAWNYGTTPTTAPSGYLIESHPQNINQYGHPNLNGMMVTDSALWFQLNIDGSIQSKIDPNKVIPYEQKVVSGGNGFIYYGQRFTGWNLDITGMKAVGSVK